jgi:hypothetical protein
MVAVKEAPQSAVGKAVSFVDPKGIEETLRLARLRVDVAQSGSGLGSGTPMVSAEMFWVQVVVFGAIMASLSIVLFWKAKRHTPRCAEFQRQILYEINH